MPSIRLSKHQLQAALQCVADKDVRYYLNGVHMRRVGADFIIESTDGHCLFQAKIECHADRQDGDFDIIVPNDAIKAALKMAKKNDAIIITTRGGDGSALNGEQWFIGNVMFFPIDGKFPDTARVIPSGPSDSHEAGQYRADLLMRCWDAMRLWANVNKRDSLKFPRLEYRGPTDCAVYRFPEDDSVLCVVMPFRT